jgi:hypothetical protein
LIFDRKFPENGVPVVMVLRARGRDLPAFDLNASGYWVSRDAPGPAPASMKERF